MLEKAIALAMVLFLREIGYFGSFICTPMHKLQKSTR